MHRQDSTYNGVFNSCGALAGTRNRSDDPSHLEQTLYYGATSRSLILYVDSKTIHFLVDSTAAAQWYKRLSDIQPVYQ